MSLISLLVAVIVVCLAWWAIHAIMGAFSIPAPIHTVVTVLFVVFVVLWLMGQLGLMSGLPFIRLTR